VTEATQQPALGRRIVTRALIATVIGLALLALGAGRTVMSRIANDKALQADTIEHARIYVKTVKPATGAAAQSVSLPGTLQGNVQAPIAARASGYLKRWHKDIGSRGREGELLAEIDSPEIDQQLSQAVAAREQAAASLDLALSTMRRWESLRPREVVSQQELDERRGAAAQARANLAAADANVERLRQLQAFKRVTAPFAGVITRRNVDTGDLIDAGGGAGRTMFVLSQTDPLRIAVNVPQANAYGVKVGQKVAVSQAELPGQTFEGQVARTAGAIDTATRTMQVEISLPNPSGMLMPGAYVQVKLRLEGGQAMTIPTNALLIRGEGVQVAVLDAEKRVQLRSIQIGRNYGRNVEVLQGLGPEDDIVLNPPDSLANGDQVTIAGQPGG
jgi:RND family efflux transporter MFP subunit